MFPYISNLSAKTACRLYNANPNFFRVVFGQRILIKFSTFLKKCDNTRQRLGLLEYILNRWTTDANRFLLAKALYETGDYQKCLDVLKKMEKRDCGFYKLFSRSCISGDLDCEGMPEKCEVVCSDADFDAKIISNYAKLVRDDPEAVEFVVKHIEKISDLYKIDDMVPKLVRKCTDLLIEHRRYRKIIAILEPVRAKIGKNCHIDALLVLSYVRIGKMDYAKEAVKELDGCKENWAVIAKTVFETETLKAEAPNE